MPQQIIPFVHLGHGAFTTALCIAFILQGRLGWRIRAGRISGAGHDIAAVKMHRQRGPVLVLLLAAGFAAGAVTAVINQGRWAAHPPHFAAGTLLVALVGAAYAVSLRIRGPASPWRTPHRLLGVASLGVYLVQLFLGLSVAL